MNQAGNNIRCLLAADRHLQTCAKPEEAMMDNRHSHVVLQVKLQRSTRSTLVHSVRCCSAQSRLQGTGDRQHVS